MTYPPLLRNDSGRPVASLSVTGAGPYVYNGIDGCRPWVRRLTGW